MIARILLGIAIIVVGYLMCARTNWFLDILGPVYWAEKHFVSGGSRTFYKLLGIAVIMLGFIVVTNLYDILIGGLVSAIF
jgi:hypothetical protein